MTLEEGQIYDICTRVWQSAVSLTALLVMSPLLVLIAVVIKLTSPGPVIYKLERVGKDGRVFDSYKFRTLYQGADSKLRKLGETDENRVLEYATPVGGLLRRTKLDEIPQLFNVIKGDMNLIGPRPARPEKAQVNLSLIPDYEMRFRVKPGLSGTAQVWGGYNTGDEVKLVYELEYIKRRSVWLDIRLVFLTFAKLLARWISPVSLLLFLFAFLSFLPQEIQSRLCFSMSGSQINVSHLLIVSMSAWLFIRKGRSNTIYVYYTVLDRPVLLFLLCGLVSSVLSDHVFLSLRGTIYYGITGFVISFIIINTRISGGLSKRAAQVIALISVGIACIGMLELIGSRFFDETGAGAASAYTAILQESTDLRISSTLGNPVALSTYLTLALPIILSEIYNSSAEWKRNIWLVAFFLSITGVFLSQTRIGILAVFVSAVVFLSAKPKFHRRAFLVCFFFFILLLMYFGGERFSYRNVAVELRTQFVQMSSVVSSLSKYQLLFGLGSGDLAGSFITANTASGVPQGINSMHLTLIAENGLIGWGLMMWIILAALRETWSHIAKIVDDRKRDILWAISSSIIGFLICMIGSNAFLNLTLQVFFWGLIGLAIGIVLHEGEKEKNYIIRWEFGH